MSSNQNTNALTRLQALLRQVYELADYARSKFDSAPLAIGRYPGHVEEDKEFCRDRDQLIAEIRSLLEQIGGPLENKRLIARLERRSPIIQQGYSPVWKGIARCKCWWDAKDELLEIADYIEELTLKTESQVTRGQIEVRCMQKRVTFSLLGKNRMPWATSSFECWFGVSIVDTRFLRQPRERSETDLHKMKVGITWELRINWEFDIASAEKDIVKVLFERSKESVIESLKKGLPLEDELVLTTQNSPDHCPYDISRIADPATPVSFIVNLESQNSPKQVQEIELFVEDIDSFCEARDVQPHEVQDLLPLSLSEDEIQVFFEEIIGENFHQEDWGGEMNDLVSSQVRIGGKRVRAAFLLKGSGTRGKLTIAKCGKNGDQIVRLVEAPVDLYVIQHIGEIDQRVIYDLKSKVRLKTSEGQECQMCVLDGTETARILRAYEKI
ncbi:hypothetical protein GF348_24360 [candidate division KSB3 bacterium]|nr:hypothetical protein [candidate division KSB3 bacterium]